MKSKSGRYLDLALSQKGDVYDACALSGTGNENLFAGLKLEFRGRGLVSEVVNVRYNYLRLLSNLMFKRKILAGSANAPAQWPPVTSAFYNARNLRTGESVPPPPAAAALRPRESEPEPEVVRGDLLSALKIAVRAVAARPERTHADGGRSSSAVVLHDMYEEDRLQELQPLAPAEVPPSGEDQTFELTPPGWRPPLLVTIMVGVTMPLLLGTLPV